MKKIITTIATSVLLCNTFTSVAQPHFDEQGNLNYRDYELLLNPATVGMATQSQLSLSAHKQWLGFEGAPLSELLQYRMPIAQHSGLGAWVHNDALGVTNNLQVGVMYAHKIRLKNNFLSFGLSLSALTMQESRITDLSDAESDKTFTDPLSSRFGFNAGFGVYYAGENLYAGVSIPQLLTNEIKENSLSNGMDVARLQYCFTGGYRFAVTDKISLSPSALLQLSGATEVGYAFMLTAAYNKRVEAGAGWASPSQLQLSVGAAVTKKLSLRYQFSQETGSEYHAGSSHFIVVRFAWGGRKPAT
ncbi:MAG: PorP/SprF family type IX secretion system membrane protein [Prevotellaceae bacterium]|nr:PorP/SprF family type IX secretion system membrane protein [Prevotellaceae bacterium]